MWDLSLIKDFSQWCFIFLLTREHFIHRSIILRSIDSESHVAHSCPFILRRNSLIFLFLKFLCPYSLFKKYVFPVVEDFHDVSCLYSKYKPEYIYVCVDQFLHGAQALFIWWGSETQLMSEVNHPFLSACDGYSRGPRPALWWPR